MHVFEGFELAVIWNRCLFNRPSMWYQRSCLDPWAWTLTHLDFIKWTILAIYVPINHTVLFKGLCFEDIIAMYPCTHLYKHTKTTNNKLHFERLLYSQLCSVFQDFFLQHCSCGAAGLAFQELKRHFRSDHHSLTASSSTLSDLSTIPEVTRIPLRAATRGQCANTPGAEIHLCVLLHLIKKNHELFISLVMESDYIIESEKCHHTPHNLLSHTRDSYTALKTYFSHYVFLPSHIPSAGRATKH